MGEIKSVKVDNWGVFFLQKLQNFFNKTDYCDLTLQFRDNSQLKVHRLVLSACTDYFNVLEQTCELVDDALIMPNELQADVVVPIVNFMYTGTLEFELKMYGKLLRTAKEMNMTVLLKLLEAHRRTMEGVNRAQRPPSPKAIRRRGAIGSNIMAQSPQQQAPLAQQRRILTSPNAPPQQRRVVQTKTIATNASSTSTSPQQSSQYRQQIGSTSLLKTNNSGVVNTGQIRAQYGNITVYETTSSQQQHIVKQEPEEQQSTSPFEQLRKGYNNNKRPLTSTIISPPAKKPNIEDVKEFAEQQRMRKQIAAEYGDDPGEYESSMLDDDIHNDDDDDDATGIAPVASSSSAMATQATTSRPVSQGATITINQNDKPPTIVVKDSTNSKMNHAKIIKEVLRQYPDLVKTNKNIRLKIMPNPNDQAKIIIKKEPLDADGSNSGTLQQSQQSMVLRTQIPAQTQTQTHTKTAETVTQQLMPPASKPIGPKPAAAVAPQTITVGSTTTPSTQKRRIDSKTMHALIALGAENTTGPWLCLRCGVNGRPISIPSYRGFRRHLINTHKETIDPALCEHCGWRSSHNRELHYHMEVEHKVKTPLYTFPECLLCAEIFLDTNALNQHMVDSHPDENKQQCIYCNKIFAREIQLYTHMKTFHKQQAIEDGIIDYSDEEFPDSQDEHEMGLSEQQPAVKEKKDSKIKILSDISLPSASSLLKLDPSSEATALSAVASGIATSINISNAPVEFIDNSESVDVSTSEPKFVNVDGNEMVLTAEQRKEIMSQLNQGHGAGGVVMVLNEPAAFTTESTVAQPNTAVVSNEDDKKESEMEAETGHTTEEEDSNVVDDGSAAEEDFDDSQIYNEFNTPNSGGATAAATTTITADETTTAEIEKKNASSTLDESKESMENLEWAENLVSAHEAAEASKAAEQKVKNDDAINQKLKELTGDWSDDEVEDEEPVISANAKLSKTVDEEEITKGTIQVDKEHLNEDKIEKKEVEKEQQEEENVLAQQAADEEKNESVLDDVAETDESKVEAEEESTANLDDSKTDEDDIDILMKSLHKDDTSESLKTAAKTAQKVETEPMVEENDGETDSKILDTSTEAEELKSEKVSDEQSDTVTSEPTNKIEEVEKSDEVKSEEASTVPSTAERDALLAELIGQTESVQDDPELLKEVDEKSATAADVTADDTPVIAMDDIVKAPAATEEPPVEKSDIEPMETDADGDTDVKRASTASPHLAAIENVTEKTADTTTVPTSCSTSSKTAETVKSLISEWGDDDDDADEEQL